MKNIIKPTQKEEAEYYSDFSGERFNHDIPEVEIKFSFEYGSKFDGSSFDVHLSDEEAKEIILLIRSKLSEKTKQKLNDFLEKTEKDYDDCIQFRDWDASDFHASSIGMYRFLLNKEFEVEE